METHSYHFEIKSINERVNLVIKPIESLDDKRLTWIALMIVMCVNDDIDDTIRGIIASRIKLLFPYITEWCANYVVILMERIIRNDEDDRGLELFQEINDANQRDQYQATSCMNLVYEFNSILERNDAIPLTLLRKYVDVRRTLLENVHLIELETEPEDNTGNLWHDDQIYRLNIYDYMIELLDFKYLSVEN